MYNNFNNNGTSTFGNSSQGIQTSQSNQASQGYQKQYQPVGLVQSFYTQPGSMSSTQGYGQVSNQSNNQGYNQGYNQNNAATESFHMANYRGNQPGHDNYLRSDSPVTSQYQPSSFQNAYSTYNGMNNQSNQFASNQSQPSNYSYSQPSITSHYNNTSQMNQQPNAQTYVSPNSYHTANYRGNQPGHDAYLRSDSSTSSMQSYQPSYASQDSTQQGYQQQGQQGYQQQGQQAQQGQSGYQSYQQQNTQPYNQTFSSIGMGQQYGNNSSH